MTSSAHGASPHQESKAGLLIFWLCLHGLALMILLAALLVVVPRFDKMFQEFGLKLPLASVVVVNLSRRLWQYGLLIIPAGMILGGGILCLLFLVDGVPRWFRKLWCCGVLIVAGGTVFVIALGIILPLMSLVQGLN
ncbi:MAG: hypothetical protein IAF94_17870 [Pirellulaceae bacterium]|nr:hypothetical protein [Pirellulaceae bacterium]